MEQDDQPYQTPSVFSDDDLDSNILELPHHRRRPPPTQQDWDRIQPIFTELYIDQGKRLKDVQSILLSRHNFHATPKMYKSRITKWKLKKYVKSSEKENIVRAIQDHNIAGDNFHRIKFNGRPARLDLVRRYCKKTGAHPDLANALPTKALEAPLRRNTTRINTNVSTSDETETPPSTVLTPSPVTRRDRRSVSFTPTPTRTVASDPAESVAWHVQQYMEWQLAPMPENLSMQQEALLAETAPFKTDQSQESTMNLIAFFELILDGLHHFATEPQHAWQLINRACASTQPILLQQNRSFVRLLIVTFTDERWTEHPILRTHVLQHLADMSSTVLGEEHELAHILRVLKSEHILESASVSILKVIVDVLTKQKPQLDDEVCDAKRSLMDLLRRRGEFIDAVQLGTEMCVEAQTTLGEYHANTRQAIMRLADSFVDEGDLDSARNNYREVLRTASVPATSTESQPFFQIDEATIFSLQALCQVDKRRGILGHDVTAEEVIETVLTSLGTSKDEVMNCLAAWSLPLSLRQRWLGSNRYSDRLLARWAIIRS